MAALAASAAVVAALLGCGADRPPPTKLDPVEAQIAGRRVWSATVGSVQFPLAVTVRDGAFIVAGGDGSVLSLDAQTGAQRWRGSAGNALGSGSS